MPETAQPPQSSEVIHPWEFYTFVALVLLGLAAVIWRYWPRAPKKTG